jgi:hypothetical protein
MFIIPSSSSSLLISTFFLNPYLVLKSLFTPLFFLQFFLAYAFFFFAISYSIAFMLAHWRNIWFSFFFSGGLSYAPCDVWPSPPSAGMIAIGVDERLDLAAVFCFLVRGFGAFMCLRLSNHLSWSFNIFLQCIYGKFRWCLSSLMKSGHAFTIYKFS